MGKNSEETGTNENHGRSGYRILKIATIILIAFCLVLISVSVLVYFLIWNSKDCSSKSCQAAVAELLNNINESVNPCDDFYQFACGKWIQRQEVPKGLAEFSATSEMMESVEEELTSLLENSPKNVDLAQIYNIARGYYVACNDLERIMNEDLKPLILYLHSTLRTSNILLRGSETKSQYQQSTAVDQFKADMKKLIVNLPLDLLVNMEVQSDRQNSSVNVIGVAFGTCIRGKLTNSETNRLEKYLHSIEDTFKNTPIQRTLNVKDLLKLCHRLEQITTPTTGNGTEKDGKSRVQLKSLSSKCSLVNFTEVIEETFRLSGVRLQPTQLIVAKGNLSTLLENFCALFEEQLKTKQGYKTLYDLIYWQIYESTAALLPPKYHKPMSNKRNFFNKNRAHFCTKQVSHQMLSDIMEIIFMKEKHQNFSFEKLRELSGNIQKAAKELFSSAQWMLPFTRWSAMDKIDEMNTFLGYQEDRMDIAALESKYRSVGESVDYFKTSTELMRIQKDESRRTINSKLKSSYPPFHRVNAFYSTNFNEMIILMGIIRKPMFDHDYPDFMNYGAIGYVLGHELGHGFDSNGIYYNKNGLLSSWMDNSSQSYYSSLVDCYIAQYGKYEFKGIKNPSQQTSRDDISDNIGITVAHQALKEQSSIRDLTSSIAGYKYTPQQLFFISTAQFHCTKLASDNNDPLIFSHSPSEIRVAGSVSNSREFAKAFKCPADAPMNPIRKCEIF